VCVFHLRFNHNITHNHIGDKYVTGKFAGLQRLSNLSDGESSDSDEIKQPDSSSESTKGPSKKKRRKGTKRRHDSDSESTKNKRRKVSKPKSGKSAKSDDESSDSDPDGDFAALAGTDSDYEEDTSEYLTGNMILTTLYTSSGSDL
jgi:hypothetical protein